MHPCLFVRNYALARACARVHAHIFTAHIVMAYMVAACIVMACMVVAYIVMARPVVVYIAMAPLGCAERRLSFLVSCGRGQVVGACLPGL